jgi:hypothetical protein
MSFCFLSQGNADWGWHMRNVRWDISLTHIAVDVTTLCSSHICTVGWVGFGCLCESVCVCVGVCVCERGENFGKWRMCWCKCFNSHGIMNWMFFMVFRDFHKSFEQKSALPCTWNLFVTIYFYFPGRNCVVCQYSTKKKHTTHLWFRSLIFVLFF